jgi:hypothetical protein
LEEKVVSEIDFQELGNELEGLWGSVRMAAGAVGGFIRSTYGEAPYSEWVRNNPEAALAEGGQPRDWRDTSSAEFEPSIMQQRAWPETTESSFVSASSAVKSAAKVLAERVAREGKNLADELWKGLRVVRGPEGKHIEYLSDRGARVSLGKLGDEAMALSDVVEHPAAFKRVPEMLGTKIRLGERSSYDPSKDLITLDRARNEPGRLKSMWHEWEHAIAHKTGLPGGTSPAKQQLLLKELELGLPEKELALRADAAYLNHPGERLARMNASMTTAPDELIELMRPVFRQVKK